MSDISDSSDTPNNKIYTKIKKQRDTYVTLLKDILRTCKESYMILDMYYSLLNHKSDAMQLSVIFLTSMLTCIQAGRTIEESYFKP